MAIKAGGIPLLDGAPLWLAANWWNYAPVILVTFYLTIAIFRQFQTRPPVQSSDAMQVQRPSMPIISEPVRTPGPTVEDPERKEKRERQRVIQLLDHAQRSAAMAMADSSSSGRVRTAERQLPSMKAAILSANKLFGIPILPEGSGAVLDLELQRRMIEMILPFLEAGHPDEAQQEAHAFLEKICKQKDGEAAST